MEIRYVILKRLDHSEFRQHSLVAPGVAPRVGNRIEVVLGNGGQTVPARVIAVQTISGFARPGWPAPNPTNVTVHAEELR